MLVVLSIYFVIGALIADWFNTRYRAQWGVPVLALHWLDLTIAWPVYVAGWYRAGRDL